MAHANQKITAPVSFADVNAVLGSNKTDLGQLCTLSNINMWAKYKPLHLSNCIGIPTEAMLKAANYGLSLFSSTSLSTIISNTNGTLNGWTYSKPSGGAASPYRLHDFNKYYHNAQPIFKQFNCNDKIKAGAQFIATITVSLESDDDLTLSDLYAASQQLFFGVAITNTSNTVITAATSSERGSATVSFTFPSNISVGTNCRCFPFLCRNQINIGQSLPENTYYTCAMLNYKAFSVVSTYIDMDIVAKYSGGTPGNCTVTIKNNDTTSHTIVVAMRFTTSANTDPLLNGEEQKTQTTIAYNETKQFVFINYLRDRNYVVTILIDGTEWRRVGILTP